MMSGSATYSDHPGTLRGRIVLGACSGDLVRLHGAIVAALEVYPAAEAVRWVLEPAVADLLGEPRKMAREAVDGQLMEYGVVAA
jgi:hypothetical protein